MVLSPPASVGMTERDAAESDREDENGDAPCGVCGDNITRETKAVSCDGCNSWFHQSCGKVTNTVYKKILKAETNNPYPWSCAECRKKGKRTQNVKYKNKEKDENTMEGDNGNPKQSVISQHKDTNAYELKSKKVIELLTKDREQLISELEQANNEIIRLRKILIDKEHIITGLVRNTNTLETTQEKEQCKVQETEPKHTHETDLTPVKRTEVGQTHESDVGNDSHTQTENDQSTEELREADVLIIGDSIIKGLPNVIKNKKIKIYHGSGARIQHFSRYIASQKHLPPVVVVHIGTNNLKNAKTPNHVMRPLWLTIETAQKKHKNTIWVVHGILYRKDIPAWYIDDINESFKFMCEELKVVYREPNLAVTSRGISRDGLHLNRVGDRQLADFILDDLGLENITYDPAQESNSEVGLITETPSHDKDMEGNGEDGLELITDH